MERKENDKYIGKYQSTVTVQNDNNVLQRKIQC